VALYSPGAKRWAMTERGRAHCHRDAHHFCVGPSELAWEGDSLRIRIRERSAPWGQAIAGEIRVWPQQLFGFSTPLDGAARHRWGPLAPSARIEVSLSAPQLRWQGQAYLDSNEGDEPIHRAFHTWDWSRAPLNDGSTLVFYDMQWPQQPDRLLALRFTPQGEVEPVEPAPVQVLPRTAWRLARRMRSEQAVSVAEQLEDTPFYQRALLRFAYAGQSLTAFHETLSVPRLVSPVVQAMLPFRMPRRG
jgi:carotenoid 1,2-hydratase